MPLRIKLLLQNSIFIAGVCAFIIFLVSLKFPIFWDGIIFAKTADYFYLNGFKPPYFILPLEIDTGHPTLFGIILSFYWTIIGKSLIATRLLFGALNFLTLYFSIEIFKYYFKCTKLAILGVLFFLLDPTLLAQSTQINPDIPLFMLFLWGWYAIIHNNRFAIILATILMVLISLRGSGLVLGLFAIQVVKEMDFGNFSFKETAKLKLTILPYYLPAMIVFLAWGYYHSINTGWWYATLAPEWSGQRHSTDLIGFFKNVIILLWRLLDFGRFFGILAMFILYFAFWKQLCIRRKKLILSFFFLLLAITAPMLLSTNPISHRYLMALHFILIILFVLSLNLINPYLKRTILGVHVLMLLSGHFWIYPDTISQGWDASLAHIPIFTLKEKAMEYIQSQKIPLNKIGTAFPLKASKYEAYLKGDTSHLRYYDPSKHPYLLYSNTINDIKPPQKGKIIWEKKSWNGVYIRLYNISTN